MSARNKKKGLTLGETLKLGVAGFLTAELVKQATKPRKPKRDLLVKRDEWELREERRRRRREER